MDKGDFVKRGFRVEPADNGGILVLLQSECEYFDRRRPGATAAFTAPAEFIEWLKDEYGVGSASADGRYGSIPLASEQRDATHGRELGDDQALIVWSDYDKPVRYDDIKFITVAADGALFIQYTNGATFCKKPDGWVKYRTGATFWIENQHFKQANSQ